MATDSGDNGGDSGGPQRAPGGAQRQREVTAREAGASLAYTCLMGGAVILWVVTILTVFSNLAVKFVMTMDGIERTTPGYLRFAGQVIAAPVVAVKFGDSVMLTILLVGLGIGAAMVTGAVVLARKVIRGPQS